MIDTSLSWINTYSSPTYNIHSRFRFRCSSYEHEYFYDYVRSGDDITFHCARYENSYEHDCYWGGRLYDDNWEFTCSEGYAINGVDC